MMFGNLFGKKPQPATTLTPAPQSSKSQKGAFGRLGQRLFGEREDGSTFFDRATAAAAISKGDYETGYNIRKGATERRDKKRREALYASPFANLGGVQSAGSAPQDVAIARGAPSQSAMSLDPVEPQFDAQGRQVDEVVVSGQRARQPAMQAPAPFRLQP
jgi:hypothetical protein